MLSCEGLWAAANTVCCECVTLGALKAELSCVPGGITKGPCEPGKEASARLSSLHPMLVLQKPRIPRFSLPKATAEGPLPGASASSTGVSIQLCVPWPAAQVLQLRPGGRSSGQRGDWRYLQLCWKTAVSEPGGLCRRDSNQRGREALQGVGRPDCALRAFLHGWGSQQDRRCFSSS